MPTDPETWSRRDSWPPTQVRLKPTVPTKDNPLPSLDDMDEDPLTYFLTPAPELDDDMDTHMMDFDAGIEDVGKPREVVRSVSPSTLDGLSKPPSRSVSPETASEITTPNDVDEDDEEEYIRFSPSNNGLLSLQDALRRRPKSPVFNRSANTGHLSPQFRGRSRGRGRRDGQTRASTAAVATAAWGRPGHLWRVPSPDVWSIEEETEEEMMSEVGSSVAAKSEDEDEKMKTTTMKAAKPKKKVRFVLPAEEF